MATSLVALSVKVLFLVAILSTRRMGELAALRLSFPPPFIKFHNET